MPREDVRRSLRASVMADYTDFYHSAVPAFDPADPADLFSIDCRLVNYIPPPTMAGVETMGTTGAVPWGYRLIGVAGSCRTEASSELASSDGVATLTTANYQRIWWYPSREPGITEYQIHRETCGTAPATEGVIGTVKHSFESPNFDKATGRFFFDDKALVGDAAAEPTTNNTHERDTSRSVLRATIYNEETTAYNLFVYFSKGGSVAEAVREAHAAFAAGVNATTKAMRYKLIRKGEAPDYSFDEQVNFIVLACGTTVQTVPVRVSLGRK